mgnify:CR=1 FL=1
MRSPLLHGTRLGISAVVVIDADNIVFGEKRKPETSVFLRFIERYGLFEGTEVRTVGRRGPLAVCALQGYFCALRRAPPNTPTWKSLQLRGDVVKVSQKASIFAGALMTAL